MRTVSEFFQEIECAKAAYKGGGLAGKAKVIDAIAPLIVSTIDSLPDEQRSWRGLMAAVCTVLDIEGCILMRHLAGSVGRGSERIRDLRAAMEYDWKETRARRGELCESIVEAAEELRRLRL